MSTTSCDRTVPYTCRIALVSHGYEGDKLIEALVGMGEHPTLLSLEGSLELRPFDLLILGPGMMSDSTPGFTRHQSEITDFVRHGGTLLVFGLCSRGFNPKYLPAEVRFAENDPSGWGNYDFSDSIVRTEHPLFNRPHRLEYLGGLQELDRIVYTAPEWKILLSKDSHHPDQEHTLTETDRSVGSIFETPWGKGHVLVCQPIIERYFAEKVQMPAHPQERGILLFENLIEYIKSQALGRPLPIAQAECLPRRGAASADFHFRASRIDSSTTNFEVLWNFGDGITGKGADCHHRYENEGVYVATATVSGPGATDRATCRVEVGPPKPIYWDEHLIEAFMTRYYPDAGRMGVNYRTALVLNGMLEVYRRNRDSNILQYLETFYNRRLISRWEQRPYKGNMHPDYNFVDVYSMAPPAWKLYQITGKPEYLLVASELWDHSLAVDNQLPPGSLWSPWEWHGRQAIVDFTYFMAHLRGVAWESTGKLELLDNAAEQMIRFRDVFMDRSDSLYFMAVDLDHKAYFTSAERPGGLNNDKWSRANGWMAMALAELMTRLPASHPKWNELSSICRIFASGLANAQDPETGLWALIIDKRDYPGMWLETTGSSMFVYSLCRLVECGALPADPYLAVARRGYNGLQQKIGFGAYDYPYISNACQGTLPRPNIKRWLEAYRNDNDLHVLGPYLLAEEAIWRTAPPDLAVIGALRSSTSGLGQALNLNGFFFYQLPSLYTQADLAGFKTIIIDRNALDRNVADVRTYYAKLLELAVKGATVVYLPQEDLQMLGEVLPDGIDFAKGSGNIAVDESWNKVIHYKENHQGIYSKKVGSGQFVYFEVNDLENLIKQVIPYTGHVK